MSYCTLDDIKSRLGEQTVIQLTDDSGTGAIHAGHVVDAIRDADDLIDSYLRGRYQVPLPSSPPSILRLSVDLAAFYLYSRRPQGMPEDVGVRYKAAITTLVALQQGKAVLDFTQAGDPGPRTYRIKAEDPMFPSDLLDQM